MSECAKYKGCSKDVYILTKRFNINEIYVMLSDLTNTYICIINVFL